MTRKLHNTLMATIASSALLVVGLIASTPVSTQLNVSAASTAIASIEAPAGIDHDAIDQADAPTSPLVRYTRHSRQSLAMPFFSFAPRS